MPEGIRLFGRFFYSSSLNQVIVLVLVLFGAINVGRLFYLMSLRHLNLQTVKLISNCTQASRWFLNYRLYFFSTRGWADHRLSVSDSWPPLHSPVPYISLCYISGRRASRTRSVVDVCIRLSNLRHYRLGDFILICLSSCSVSHLFEVSDRQCLTQ